MKRLAVLVTLLLAGCSQAAATPKPTTSHPTAAEWRAVQDKLLYLEGSNDDLRLRLARMRDEVNVLKANTGRSASTSGSNSR